MGKLAMAALFLCSCAGMEPDASVQDVKSGSFSLSPSSAAVTAQVGVAPAPVATTLKDSTKAGHAFKVACTGGVVATPATGTVTKAAPAALSLQAPAPSAAGSTSPACTVSSTTGSASSAVFTLKLTATGASGFSLAIAPPAQTVAPGGSAAFSVSTSGSGQIALSLAGLPAGVTGTLSPSSVAAGQSSALTLSAAAGAAPGTSPFQVTGASGGATHSASASVTVATSAHAIETVFIILLENHNWSQIKGSASAHYLNGTLLPMASRAEQYFNPPGMHPSEPNYLWLEAGTNFGIKNDGLPSANHQATTQHLTTLLEAAGISWKAYAEGISGSGCPTANAGLYAPKHVPFVFFDDVASSARCAAHVRPFSELSADLQSGHVARYNFITPDLCDDMHNSTGCVSSDAIKNGDDWLAAHVPAILGSQAYRAGGALFITFDESEGGDVPVMMLLLSAFARGNGYSNTVHYTHSSLLRTVQEIFGVTPLLGDAANATDLSDLFATFP